MRFTIAAILLCASFAAAAQQYPSKPVRFLAGYPPGGGVDNVARALKFEGKDGDGGRLLHWLDDALTFLVYPGGEERGVVRLRGSWTLEENSEAP